MILKKPTMDLERLINVFCCFVLVLVSLILVKERFLLSPAINILDCGNEVYTNN